MFFTNRIPIFEKLIVHYRAEKKYISQEIDQDRTEKNLIQL